MARSRGNVFGGLSAGGCPGVEFRVVLFGALRGEESRCEHPTVLELTVRAGAVQRGALVLSLRGVARAQGLFEPAPCHGTATIRLVRQPGVSFSVELAPRGGDVLRICADAQIRLKNPVFTASSYSTTLVGPAAQERASGELRLDFRHELGAIILSSRLRKPERKGRGGDV